MKKIKINKRITESILWVFGFIIIIKLFYRESSWMSIGVTVLLFGSSIWFLISLINIANSIKYYFNNGNWEYNTKQEWVLVILSLPSLLLSLLLYAYFMSHS